MNGVRTDRRKTKSLASTCIAPPDGALGDALSLLSGSLPLERWDYKSDPICVSHLSVTVTKS